MDEQTINFASLLTVTGGSAAVGLIILTFKAVFKDLWNDLANRLCGFILSEILVYVAIWQTGGASVETWILGFFLGAQICLAVLGGANAVSDGIVTAAKRSEAKWLEAVADRLEDKPKPQPHI